MLPDIRAIIAAVVTALGLLMMSFGLAATFRVAQDYRSGSLQADLAQRGRGPVPEAGPRAIPIIETPAPAEPVSFAVAETIEAAPSPPQVALLSAPQAEPLPEPMTEAPLSVAEAPAAVSEPPIGGPLQSVAVQTAPARDAAVESAARSAAKAAAAKKARAVRVARIARERKAAARRARALEARRAKENTVTSAPAVTPFGNFSRE